MLEQRISSRFVFVALLTIMFSCTSSHDLVVELHNSSGNLSQAAYFESPQLVALEETSVESSVGYIDKIFLLEDRIGIMDIMSTKLVLFDKEGKFIASTSKLIGKGNNEYTHFTDCAIDTEKQLIYMYCDRPYKFLVFDSNLNLLKCIPTKDFISEFTFDKKYMYAFCKKDMLHFELRRYDRRDITGDYKVLLSSDKIIYGVKGMGFSLCGNDDHIYFSMPFSDEIQEIKNGAIVNTLKLNFGDEWFSYENSKKLRGRRFFKRCDDKCWTIQNIFSSDSSMFFNTNKVPFYRIDKVKNVGDSYRYVVETQAPYSSSWFPACCGKKGYVVQEIPMKAVRLYLNGCKEKNKEPMPSMKNLSLLNTKENPVLQILKLK